MAILNWKSQEEIDKEVAEANAPTEEELQMKAIRIAVQKLVRIDELSTDELLDLIDLYESYQVDKSYKVDDIFKYEGSLYKVIQEHTSLENWIPSELPALYLNLMPENVIPEWVQPTGSHDSYSIGDKVIFEGEVYESTIDNNTWSPADYPQGWKLITP